MSDWSRPDKLGDETPAPPPAKLTKLTEVKAEKIDDIEPEPQINQLLISAAEIPKQSKDEISHEMDNTEPLFKQAKTMAEESEPVFHIDHAIDLYSNNDEYEGRIGLFNSHTCLVEEIAKFGNCYEPYKVATTEDKIFGIDSVKKTFETFDLKTKQILKGPDPPEWRNFASVVYFKNKLYYLGGEDPNTGIDTNRIDIDLNNGDQSALQEDKTKSQLNLINPPDVIAARGAHQSIYNDSSANGSKSGTSADKIEEFQKSTNEVRNKLTDARDATPIFDDGNEVQQTIDVINVEVFVKFLLEGSSEKYTCILNVSEGANVISLISKTQAKAQWTSENLKLQMVKLCDVGTKQYNDITQFYNSLTVSANQKYEFIFKNEEKSKGVTVNVTANGEPHNGIQFDLVAGSSVQLLIDDAFFKFNQAASTGTINFVEVFNSNFKEWISVDKPYDKTLIDLDCNYSISINYSDTSTISNGSPAQDLINQPTTAPIQTTNLDIPAPSTSEMNAPVPPNRNSFAGQPSAQTNTTLPYSQEKIIKDEEDSNRATANSTPSGIGDIAQMPGPSDTQCKKNCGGDNIRVTKVEELEDSLEQATTNCRPDVEKRKTRVNLKDKDQNSTHPHDVKKRPSQIEGKTPNDEPKPKQAKKDKPGAMNDIYDMYQLNPSLLTDKDESLISHPDFRLGNIRAAAIECGIHYNKNKKVCHGINDMIRKTVVCLMAQLFKHGNTLKYTAAQKLKPEMTKFPEQVSTKIAAGMIKLIEIKLDTATISSETGMKMPADQWTQLIYQEIEHALRNSPTRNTTKPLFKRISDEDHICKLKLDQQAVQSGWYIDPERAKLQNI